MSIFIPYSPSDALVFFTELFSLDLTTLTAYETLVVTLLSNLYFFVFWFIIMYFVLKIFNRIWQRFF